MTETERVYQEFNQLKNKLKNCTDKNEFNKIRSRLYYLNNKYPSLNLMDVCKTDHAIHDVDYNELLIRDSITELNCGKAKEVYCFCDEQAEAIIKGCNFKCNVSIVNGTYVIRRIEAHRVGVGKRGKEVRVDY